VIKVKLNVQAREFVESLASSSAITSQEKALETKGGTNEGRRCLEIRQKWRSTRYAMDLTQKLGTSK
jgi:hypothetical protein